MTIPKLLLDRLPADFHKRLCNWGEVMRDRRRRAVSPTYQICKDLARRAGQTRNLEEDPRDEWDEPDADFMEAAWRNAVYRILHQHRELLRAHYVEHAYWKMTCRALSIRPREYDDTLVRAVGNFEDFVAQYASRVHNLRQDSQTTV
ncbi:MULTISPECIES: hypothetical protein [Achromobacter]|uniref:Uncharacterized protein n=1 Tax=Achromobacter pulmonis TaxID=1389932 RepID=A0A6S7DL25_9BURK|nr:MULTISPECIES: hypothetical protein [Achromobacter]CAB3889370.1 hypothetical protein LMG26788_03694 [Achromobacter pulmonis]CAB3890697.1 hypothetical protein LMG26788_03760 [Achromobacter pulmonis]CUJ51548.1 Uncharacterised protein [Achromobacter xylosoxidans]